MGDGAAAILSEPLGTDAVDRSWGDGGSGRGAASFQRLEDPRQRVLHDLRPGARTVRRLAQVPTPGSGPRKAVEEAQDVPGDGLDRDALGELPKLVPIEIAESTID